MNVLTCVILLVSIVLGHDLVAHDTNGNNIMTCTQCFGQSTPFKWCGIESLDCACVMICKRPLKEIDQLWFLGHNDWPMSWYLNGLSIYIV